MKYYKCCQWKAKVPSVTPYGKGENIISQEEEIKGIGFRRGKFTSYYISNYIIGKPKKNQGRLWLPFQQGEALNSADCFKHSVKHNTHCISFNPHHLLQWKASWAQGPCPSCLHCNPSAWENVWHMADAWNPNLTKVSGQDIVGAQLIFTE